MRAGSLGLLVALVLLFSLLLPGRFATFGTLQSMMFQLPELGLLALAMVIPLISGGLNLAIIATDQPVRAADGLDHVDLAAGRAPAGRRRRWWSRRPCWPAWSCAPRSAWSRAFSSPPWASTRSW